MLDFCLDAVRTNQIRFVQNGDLRPRGAFFVSATENCRERVAVGAVQGERFRLYEGALIRVRCPPLNLPLA